ncbi:MAG TPA: hypothetical protein VGV61_10765 [Thermoanaerobaculia bacterium]|jgi:hypothetical protein|nr:hypothetical protein [Thermoanaerobaculia bacterium]
MRTIVVDERTDLEGLRKRLVGGKTVSAAALERLRSLNPHLDLAKIPAGSVLLLPDLPGVRKGETSSVTGDPFADLSATLLAGVDAAVARAREGGRALLAEQKEVGAAIKSAAFRRAVEADPELGEQAEAAARVFKQDQEEAKASAEDLKTLRQEAAAELAALAKLLD